MSPLLVAFIMFSTCVACDVARRCFKSYASVYLFVSVYKSVDFYAIFCEVKCNCTIDLGSLLILISILENRGICFSV